MEMKTSLMSYEYIFLALLGAPNPNWLLIFVVTLELNWNWGLLRHMLQTTGTVLIGLQQTLNCIQGANAWTSQITRQSFHERLNFFARAMARNEELSGLMDELYHGQGQARKKSLSTWSVATGKDGTRNAIGLSY
jgi:hypothetical protein